MRAKEWRLGLLGAVAAVTLAACTSTGMQSQASATDIPRTPGGKPDFNGIWQVLSTANNNLESAPAKAAFALVPGDFVPVPAPEVVALGAVGAVPASFGVVEATDAMLDVEDWTDRADAQLYAAKNSGRNRVCVEDVSFPRVAALN